MLSFARVVHSFMSYRGGQSDESLRRMVADEARADLYDLFSKRNWRAFEKTYDVILWGKETQKVQAVAVGDTIIRFQTATPAEKWVGQDIALDNLPYLIKQVNVSGAGGSIRIDPAYNGAALAAATEVDIRQIRIGLPAGFGAILGPVIRDDDQSVNVGDYDMVRLTREASGGGAANMHSVVGQNLEIWPPQSGRLFFRYRWRPDGLYYYLDGSAIVDANHKRTVTGTSTKWKRLPSSGDGSILEEQDNIDRGMPVGTSVLLVKADGELSLKADWDGTTGTTFKYVVSTELNLPPQLVRVVHWMARLAAKKASAADVRNALFDAIESDQSSDEPDRSGFAYAGNLVQGASWFSE